MHAGSNTISSLPLCGPSKIKPAVSPQLLPCLSLTSGHAMKHDKFTVS